MAEYDTSNDHHHHHGCASEFSFSSPLISSGESSGSSSGGGTAHHWGYGHDPEEDEEEEGSEDIDVDVESSRSVSPAPTVQSITESLYLSLSVEKHGRAVNATNSIYSMAADRREVVRQAHEHEMYRYILSKLYGKDLYIGPVEEVLAEDTNLAEDKMIMDWGTGTAAWAIDMANRFPHVQVLGIDLSPLQPESAALPMNCRIEVDDLNLDVSHYYQTASLVHIRVLAAGIKDYPGLISQATQCLIPGGLLHIIEPDFRPYSAPHIDAVVTGARQKKYSPSGYFLNCLITAMHAKMANCDAGPNLKRWIGENRGLEMVECHDAYMPLFSMFPDTTQENKVYNEFGRMMSIDWLQFISNARPLLLDQFSVIQIDTLERQIQAEVQNPEQQLWFRYIIQSLAVFGELGEEGDKLFKCASKGLCTRLKLSATPAHISPSGGKSMLTRGEAMILGVFVLSSQIAASPVIGGIRSTTPADSPYLSLNTSQAISNSHTSTSKLPLPAPLTVHCEYDPSYDYRPIKNQDTTMSIFKEEWIVGPENTKFYTRFYPASSDPVASIVFVHGFQEHITRYDHVFTRFATTGKIDVFGYDQRGWGRTACDEANKTPSSAYGLTNRKHQLDDLEFFVEREAERVGPNRPIFVFGHSMGGGIVLSFGSSKTGLPASSTISRLTGIISSSPLIKETKPVAKPLRWVAALLSNIVPWMNFPADVPSSYLTTDPKVNAEAEADPMMKTFATIGCINDMLSAGAYHEIHNEPKWWTQDVDDIIQFMKDTMAQTGAKL
ncbi:hypothetical protein FRB97_001974 [Tulasnella sp. 331]|nr:hypothetical protein FRB97_001974 [Tulasnella sp. 331]